MASDENHRKFLSHLAESQEAVAHVARWMVGQGRDVFIKGARFAESHEDWEKFADYGDLFVLQRIEVKRLSVKFTSANDWPFGDKFIVCARHAWDRAKNKPAAFIILSADMGHAAFVTEDTAPSWYCETRTDSRYTGPAARQEFYFCPLNLVQWRSIPT